MGVVVVGMGASATPSRACAKDARERVLGCCVEVLTGVHLTNACEPGLLPSPPEIRRAPRKG
jgi:hypothetical protein